MYVSFLDQHVHTHMEISHIHPLHIYVIKKGWKQISKYFTKLTWISMLHPKRKIPAGN